MERLRGADAQFIYQERPYRHLHTLKVAVVGPGGHPYSFERTVETVRDRLHLVDPLRWRLERVPGGLFHPVWMDEGDIDLAPHIKQCALPRPGGRAELTHELGRIMSSSLDRRRPLWELWVIEGLADDRVALALKIHHAIADGSASLRLLGHLLDETADPPPAARPPTLPRDGVASRGRMVVEAGRDLGRLAGQMPSMVARVARAARGKTAALDGDAKPARAFSGRVTRFNLRFESDRSLDQRTLPLADIRKAKDALDGTVNDVVLALVSTAVRGYLADKGELPAEPISTAVPVGFGDRDAQPWGNMSSSLFVNLHTDVADPISRFRAIQSSARAAKAWHDQREHSLMDDWMNAWPLWSLYARGLPWLANKTLRRPSYHMVTSNVRGPVRPLYHQGLPVVALWSWGPLVMELGLNVTVWSYLDELSFGVHAIGRHVPDVDDLGRRFGPALDELLAGGER